MIDQLKQALSDLDEEKVQSLVQERLAQGEDPLAIIASCREGIADVGKRYENNEYYVSDLIMAGEVFKDAMAKISENFKIEKGSKRGTVVIGTVKGDIHDIGKDIVVSLLQAANYDTIDLGVDVSSEKFVETVKESGATVVGLSGLLTISFDSMKDTVAALKASGMKVKVMIGGGSTTEQVLKHVGADALGVDAQEAVRLCDAWITSKEAV